MTEEEDPQVCPACGAEQDGGLSTDTRLYFMCRSQAQLLPSMKWYWAERCKPGWAWAAQHRPLLRELVAALKAYQASNRLHHDADAELFEMGRAALAKVAAQD